MSTPDANDRNKPNTPPAPPPTGDPLDPATIQAHLGIANTKVLPGLGTVIEYSDTTSAFIPLSQEPKGQLTTVGGHTVLLDPYSGNIIKDYGASSSGGGAATGGQLLSNAQQQAQLAEDQRQYNETFGYNKARGDQQQRVSEGNLGVSQGQLGVNQGQLALQQAKQSFDQYKTLADLASNPRNYVQTFFMNRGYQAPPDVSRYGNTTSTAADIPSFSSFLGRVGAGAGSSSPAPALTPAVPKTGPQNYTSPGPAGGYGIAQGAPLQNVQQGTTTTPIALSDFAVRNNLDLSKEGPQFDVNKPKMYAQGGTLHMSGPHAVVDLTTGRVRAIAGERGPENAYFDGAAIIDPGLPSDPYNPDPYSDPIVSSGIKSPGGGLAYPYDPTADTTNYSAAHENVYQQATPLPLPQPIDYTQSLAPAGFHWQGGVLAQDAVAAPPPPGGGTATGGTDAIYQGINTQTTNAPGTTTPPAGGTTTTTPPGVMTPPPPAPPQPISLPPVAPLAATSAPQNAVNPANPTAPTFGQPIPAQMPTFLAGEDFQAQSPVIRALQQQQGVPPFLRRLYGQARGEQAYGTNTPQRTDLPPDLPLISSLAWSQMSPSEQQAFLSIVSSLGVDPQDYLAMISGASPTGPSAHAPTFGSNFLGGYRQ